MAFSDCKKKTPSMSPLEENFMSISVSIYRSTYVTNTRLTPSSMKWIRYK